MAATGEWVNLVRTPEEKAGRSRLVNGGREGARAARAGAVKVLEHTPVGKGGTNKSRTSEVGALRAQVASLVREKRDLSLRAAEGEELLNGAKEELQSALKAMSQGKGEMEDQRRVIHRLSTDNARLIRQVESLWQQSPELKSPSNSHVVNHTTQDHTHHNNILVKDLERLSQRATELSQALATTQQERTTLEREVLSLKRIQLELQTSRSQLEEALTKSEEERAELYCRLHDNEEGGRRRSEQLQLQMEAALNNKTAKLEELLSLSERLQSALTSLSEEKNVLEGSLRDEVANCRQLVAERNGLKVQVRDIESRLVQSQTELALMQDHQLHEVTEMKELLERELGSLEEERDGLREEVEGGRGERETLQREILATRAELITAEREIERLSEELGRLQGTLEEMERERAREASEMTDRHAELVAHCEQLEREGEEREGTTRQQIEQLKDQLAKSGIHGNQLEAEAEQLRQLLDARSHDLQARSRDLDSAQSELHVSKMQQSKLEQQVSGMEGKVLALNEQIRARTELTNEMRGLLEQRANQIQELDMIVAEQREELLSASSHTHLTTSHAHFTSGDSAHITQATPIHSPYSSRPISPEPHPHAMPSSNEVARLRKQLSESRSRVLKLESSCEEIRTTSAKYEGSLQALMTIRERLTEENRSLSEAKRRAEEGQRSAEEGRRRAEEGKKALSRQLSSLQSLVTSLRSQLSELRGEREEAMSQISELQEVYAEREAELAEEMAAIEVQSVAASETGDMEKEYLQLELAKSRASFSDQEQLLASYEKVMERECDEMQNEVDRCTADLCTLRRGETQVTEECRLTAAVNAKQTNQIAEKEGHVSELMGEVEVLRARRSVMMKWLTNTDNEKGLRLELESVRGELESCRDAHAAELVSLTQQLESEREGRSQQESGRGLEGRGQRGCRREERLRSRLKSQVEQGNYLRVKLGYTLKELQLYKELKGQLDSQLTQQATEISSLQEHYSDCLQQLQQVERLGFQATVSPSNNPL